MAFSNTPTKEVLSIKELAAFIGFCPDTVYDWVSRCGLPVHRVGPRGRIRIHYTEYIKWNDARTEARDLEVRR